MSEIPAVVVWNSLSQSEIYPQKAESLVHIHISTGGAIVAQATAVRVIVVIIHVYAVLPGAEPFIVRPVRVATAIKCHFHSGDCFGFGESFTHW